MVSEFVDQSIDDQFSFFLAVFQEKEYFLAMLMVP